MIGGAVFRVMNSISGGVSNCNASEPRIVNAEPLRASIDGASPSVEGMDHSLQPQTLLRLHLENSKGLFTRVGASGLDCPVLGWNVLADV